MTLSEPAVVLFLCALEVGDVRRATDAVALDVRDPEGILATPRVLQGQKRHGQAVADSDDFGKGAVRDQAPCRPTCILA